MKLLPSMNHDIPLMYSWYPPDVLMVSPDVLNTPQCTEHTLCRVRTLSQNSQQKTLATSPNIDMHDSHFLKGTFGLKIKAWVRFFS